MILVGRCCSAFVRRRSYKPLVRVILVDVAFLVPTISSTFYCGIRSVFRGDFEGREERCLLATLPG